MMVNGQRHAYLRKSIHEAKRAAQYLTAATGEPIDALGVIVLVGAKTLTIRQEPEGVAVIRIEQLKHFLTRQLKKTVPASDTARQRAAAVAPGTWTTRDSVERTLLPWFANLRRTVNQARTRRLGWAAGVATAGVAAFFTFGSIDPLLKTVGL